MSALRTCATGAIVVLLASSVSSTSRSFRPDFTFTGSSLAGFQAVGKAEWRAEDGEIVGTAPPGGDGWLMLDRSYQDVAFFASFRCTGRCRTGVLLRAERTPTGGRAGIYVSLTEGDLAAYRVTLDAAGRELTRKPLQFGRGSGRTDFTASSGGGAEEFFAAGLRSGDWNTIEILLDIDLLRPSLNKNESRPMFNAIHTRTDETAADYGPLALYVGGAGEVRFRDVSYKDLQPKPSPREEVSNRFTMQRLTEFFYSFSPAVADINRDGVLDVVAGPYYYLGPDYTLAREIYRAQTFNPSTMSPKGSRVTLAYDFTGDGWPDVLSFDHSQENRGVCRLYVNTRGESRRWPQYPVLKSSSEVKLLKDLDGDGIPEVVFASDGVIGYAKPDPANPTAPWIFHAVSEGFVGDSAATPVFWGEGNQHGVGVGDINGDGRPDILYAGGWWEQPVRGTSAGPWAFHPYRFGGRDGGAEMAVYDVNGDGRNDVVTSLAAHGFGLAWFEQQRDANGRISFAQHMIMDDFGTTNAGDVTFSQLHGASSADVDGDGVPDFIVGKRTWSHQDGYADPDPYGPAVLYLYRTVRDSDAPGGARFVPELIHNRSGAGSHIDALDLNQDGVVDIVTAARRGTFIFWGKPRGNAGIPPR